MGFRANNKSSQGVSLANAGINAEYLNEVLDKKPRILQ